MDERTPSMMSKVFEKLREEVERVQLLGAKKPGLFEAARDSRVLKAAFQKFDREYLWDCNMCPVAQVSKDVQDLHNQLVAERDAMLKEESNQFETKVEMTEEGDGWRLYVSSIKWDGAITAMLEAIESMGLRVVHAKIACDKLFVFDAFLEEEAAPAEQKGDVNK